MCPFTLSWYFFICLSGGWKRGGNVLKCWTLISLLLFFFSLPPILFLSEHFHYYNLFFFIYGKKKSCCGQVLDVKIENIIWELIFQTTWTVERDVLAWRNWKRSPIDLLSSTCSLAGKIACLFAELLRCPLRNHQAYHIFD